MATRYVVVVRSTEDSMCVFGAYRERERAEAFAKKLNAELERREDADFEAWQARDLNTKDASTRLLSEHIAPDGYGRAGVLIVHAPRYREGLAFALTGNPDPTAR